MEGIDPGMTRSGLARLLVDDNQVHVVWARSWKPTDLDSFVGEALSVTGMPSPLYERFVVVEEPYYNRLNPRGYASQVTMVEILKYLLGKRGTHVCAVNPMQARAAVGAPRIIRGAAEDPHERQRAKKQQIRDGLNRIFGEEAMDDVLAEENTISGKEACCDAIAIAYAGWILHIRPD